MHDACEALAVLQKQEREDEGSKKTAELLRYAQVPAVDASRTLGATTACSKPALDAVAPKPIKSNLKLHFIQVESLNRYLVTSGSGSLNR